jgi:glycosyltransferase involved in cell wall biosynthesis
MLNYEFPPIGGGAGQAHANLLEQFQHRSELSIDVLTSAPNPGFTQKQLSSNITLYRVGLHKQKLHYWRKREVLEWLLKAKRHYRRLLQQHTYDLVHAFFGFPSAWLCYRTAGRIPYMISLRGSDVPGQHARLQREYQILAPIFRRIWQHADLLVACSQGLKERALRFYPGLRIEVVPNGVHADRFTPGPITEHTVSRLISVGRLSVTKRLDLLIKAVEVLKSKGLTVHLKLVGDGSQYESLAALIRDLSLDEQVTLSGRIDAHAMPALYRDSDLYVSATLQEGMSNAMLEAMASGLPIVTTPCEGVDELVHDNGIILQEPTAAALADAVGTLLLNKEKCIEMSKAARRRAEMFSWEKVADQYITCYRVIASKEATKP